MRRPASAKLLTHRWHSHTRAGMTGRGFWGHVARQNIASAAQWDGKCICPPLGGKRGHGVGQRLYISRAFFLTLPTLHSSLRCFRLVLWAVDCRATGFGICG